MNRKILVGAALMALVAAAAFAAGTYTNGFPLVGATTQSTASSNGAGVAQLAPNGIYTNVGSTLGLVPLDTGLPGGQSPQTVGASPFQVAATASEMIANTATSTVHAATLNTRGGLVTTESLNTAAGASYTFNLTNSQLTLTSAPPQVGVYSGTNTGGAFTVTSVVNVAGGATIVIKNTGSTAFNGTILIAFHVQGV